RSSASRRPGKPGKKVRNDRTRLWRCSSLCGPIGATKWLPGYHPLCANGTADCCLVDHERNTGNRFLVAATIHGFPRRNRMRSLRVFFSFLLMLFGCGSRPGPYQKKDGVWYFNDLRVAEKGPPDFAPLSGPFAKSSIAGYYRGSAIPDSDGPSFAALS